MVSERVGRETLRDVQEPGGQGGNTTPHAPRPTPHASRPTAHGPVFYFTGRYWPGSMAIPVHAELARALGERGRPTAIVTLAPPGQREPVALVPDGDLPVYRVATGRHLLDRAANRYARDRYDYPYLLTVARYLRPWLRERLRESAAPPVLQAEIGYPMGALVRRAAPGAARAVVSLHGGDVLFRDAGGRGSYGRARSPVVRRELGAVFAWAGAVRAMSPLLARRAVELGCPQEKIAVIPPNIAEVFFPTRPLPELRARSRAEVLAELGLPDDARLLLASGRALPIKGFDTLVAALPAVLARHPATHLLLYGPDRDDTLAALRSQLATAGLAQRVHLLGELPFAGQNRYLAAADLAVIPSLLDGFNKFGAEAGAHGTPLVASTAAGIADYVRDYGAGRTVPPADAPALAEAITALLSDRDEWDRAGQAATRLAEECRTARVADALVALYERLEGGPLLGA